MSEKEITTIDEKRIREIIRDELEVMRDERQRKLAEELESGERVIITP